jgi:UbiD family decarboxylase
LSSVDAVTAAATGLPQLDLRHWLDAVGRCGELQEVHSADWRLEIGGISEINYQRAVPAAMLFDRIPGYPDGRRVLTGSVSSARRLGLTLRLGTALDDDALVQALRGKPNEWAQAAADHPPREVDDAHVRENVVEGTDVNLLDFPAPLWHEHDGGRYIGTGCIVFTTDPDTGQVNGGAYRMQIQQDGRSATLLVGPAKHGGLQLRKWFEREGRAPVTVSLGHDPLLLVVGGTEVPTGVSELDYAGAIVGEPVDVTMARNGLPIPATSEIALEGWVYEDRLRDEGPFGEWTGYYSKGDGPALEMEITAVYHRDDPILLGAPPGRPPHDYSYMRTAMKSAMVLDALVQTGIPEIRNVWAHEAGGGRLLLVVAIRQRYCGHSRQAGLVAGQLQAAAYMNRYVVVVDEDVDVRSLDQVVWAMCTRSDPAEDIEIVRKCWGSTADPLLTDPARPYNSRAIIDACRPFERIGVFPRIAASDPARLQSVRAKWAHVFDREGGNS